MELEILARIVYGSRKNHPDHNDENDSYNEDEHVNSKPRHSKSNVN